MRGKRKKIIAVCQVRMGSSRLPGKALSQLKGEPMLSVIVKRVLSSQLIDSLVIATTRMSLDDPIERLARELNLTCFRGDEEDCLDRVYRAVRRHHPEIVVRLTGDNPFVNGQVIDWVLKRFIDENPPCDYMCLGETFPVGLSVEVLTFEALSAAWKEEMNPDCREHVTPFVSQNPARFKTTRLVSPSDYSHLRWTVDTSEDLDFARHIFGHFDSILFDWHQAVALIEAKPALVELNAGVEQRHFDYRP